MKNIFKGIAVAFCVFFTVSFYTGKCQTLSDSVKFQEFQLKVGASVGSNFPYAPGLEASVLFDEIIDISAGFALANSGFRFGFGSRFYPMRFAMVSPLAGAYFYYFNGLHSVAIDNSSGTGYYSIPMNMGVVVNSGLRLRIGKGHYLLASAGYSALLFDDTPRYIRGAVVTRADDFEKYTIGKLSLNLSFLFKLNRGYYRLDYNKPYLSK